MLGIKVGNRVGLGLGTLLGSLDGRDVGVGTSTVVTFLLSELIDTAALMFEVYPIVRNVVTTDTLLTPSAHLANTDESDKESFEVFTDTSKFTKIDDILLSLTRLADTEATSENVMILVTA